jgi:hypothetical protein
MKVFYLYIMYMLGMILCTGVLSSQPKYVFEIEVLTEINGSDTPIGHIIDAKFDENNNLYLLDDSQQLVHIFNQDGDFKLSVGGQGRGPGEFLNASAGFTIDDSQSKLYLIDYPNSRVLSLDIEHFSDHEVIPLRNSTAISTNKLLYFSDGLLFLGSHQHNNKMIHRLTKDGDIKESFGEFLDFDSFFHNNMGKMQLSQVSASRLGNLMLVGLAAPNIFKLYDENFELIRSFTDNTLPKPWISHMTMEPTRYRSKFYSMGIENQIMSESVFLFHWSNVLDSDGPIIEFQLELRSMIDGKILHHVNLEDLYIYDIHRISNNHALFFARDKDYNYSIYELNIIEQ